LSAELINHKTNGYLPEYQMGTYNPESFIPLPPNYSARAIDGSLFIIGPFGYVPKSKEGRVRKK
jgi:hypothetical protein